MHDISEVSVGDTIFVVILNVLVIIAALWVMKPRKRDRDR